MVFEAFTSQSKVTLSHVRKYPQDSMMVWIDLVEVPIQFS
jgi:hypothetical protein